MTSRSRLLGAWLYVAVLLVVWAALWHATDDASLVTVLAFGPRWVWAMPLFYFLPLPGRRLGVPFIVAALVVAGPIMGFVAAGVWARPPRSAGPAMRLITANLGSRLLVPAEFASLIASTHPDVVLMQECTERAEPAFAGSAWYFHSDDGLCLGSRLPVEGAVARYRQNTSGHGAFGARYRVRLGDAWIDLANLHLDTPRDGIMSLLRGSGGLGGMQAAIAQRRQQSRLVRQWLADADQTTLVTGGDFNLLEESVIYRESWGQLRNGFSAAGVGWGFTKRENWLLAARIDHVLVGPRWQVTRAWVDEASGSDHRPLVIDMVLAQ